MNVKGPGIKLTEKSVSCSLGSFLFYHERRDQNEI